MVDLDLDKIDKIEKIYKILILVLGLLIGTGIAIIYFYVTGFGVCCLC